MGHVRVGRLPKRFGWQHVIGGLYGGREVSGPTDRQILGAATTAAGRTLIGAQRQESLAHAYWYLLRLALASRSDTFTEDVRDLGIEVSGDTSGFSFLAQVTETLRKEMRNRGWIAPVDEMALQAFQTALADVVAEESQSLFGSTVETAQFAIRRYSTKENVASLGRRFFSEFVYRALSRALERELASSAAADGRFKHEGELAVFRDRLKSYCWDVSKIVEDYAGGWYSKHAWLDDVTEQNTKRFTAYAVEKLLTEAAPSLTPA